MEKYLPYITTLIAVGGFVFSALKYIDMRNREEKRLKYEKLNSTAGQIATDCTNGQCRPRKPSVKH